MAPTEYRAHKVCIELAERSTRVYKVGMAPTEYIKRMKLVSKYVATQSATVYKVGKAPTKLSST